MVNKLYLLQKYLEKEGLSSESIKTSELIDLYSLNKNAEFLTAKRDRLQSITWNGKTYNALGYLPDGSPVALVSKKDIESKDVSSSGPFKLLGQTNISVTNADETQNYNLAQYQGGNVLPVSVRPGATGVVQNKIKVDYGDASSADIAIEIGGILGAFPLLGEPVDIASGVIAAYKDPPDYILAAISILCAVPVLGIGAAVLKPALRRLGSAKEIGEKIGEEMAKNMEPELIAPAVKEAKELAHEVLDKVAEKIPKNTKPIQETKKVVEEVLHSIDVWLSKNPSLSKVKDNLKGLVDSAARSLKDIGVDFSGSTIAVSGADTINYIGAKFKGKEVVVKVSVDGFKNTDLWRRLLEIKKSLPDNYKKFIPEIYDTKVKSGISSDAADGASIVIMEKLFPPSSDLKSIIRGEGDALTISTPPTTSFVSIGNDYLSSLDSTLNDAIEAYNKPNKLPLPPVNWKDYIPSIEWYQTYIYNEKMFSEWAASRGLSGELANLATAGDDVIREYAYSAWEKYSDFYNEIPLSGKSKEFFENFWKKHIDDNLTKVTPGKSARYNKPPPFYGYGPIDTSFIHPELREFYDFLNHIAEKYNFKWGDLHEENIMVDSAGVPKLMDIGRFWDATKEINKY